MSNTIQTTPPDRSFRLIHDGRSVLAYFESDGVTETMQRLVFGSVEDCDRAIDQLALTVPTTVTMPPESRYAEGDENAPQWDKLAALLGDPSVQLYTTLKTTSAIADWAVLVGAEWLRRRNLAVFRDALGNVIAGLPSGAIAPTLAAVNAALAELNFEAIELG